MKIVPKITAVVAGGALLLAAAGCSSTGASGSGSGSDKGHKRIALLMASLTTDFFVQAAAEAKKYAQEHDIDLTITTSDNDPSKELSNMQDIVGQSPAAILFDPVDSNSGSAAVKLANAAKIPVFTVDRGVTSGETVAHVASDNTAGGKLAADYLKDQFPKGAKVAELQGILSTDIAGERGGGFEKELATGDNLDLVAKQSADFDKSEGFTVFQNILQANPDLDAVFAQNDEMALGAVQAAQAAGRKDLVIVGFDGSPDALDAIKAGQMSATVAQLPAKIVDTAFDAAVQHLDGKKVEAEIGVPLKLVTK